MKEITAIIDNRQNYYFPLYFQTLTFSQINYVSNSELKGILFMYYSIIGDKQAYLAVNERSRRYVQKLNEGISEEGYTIREQLLERENSLENRESNNHSTIIKLVRLT